MQHVTEQHGVARIICNRKNSAIVTTIVDWRLGFAGQIDPDDTLAQQRAQMMSDEAAAAAHIQDLGTARNRARNLQGHVVGPADLSPPPFAHPTASDSVEKSVGQIN